MTQISPVSTTFPHHNPVCKLEFGSSWIERASHEAEEFPAKVSLIRLSKQIDYPSFLH